MESVPHTGQHYQHVRIGDSSRAHLGNVYNHYGPSPDERILNGILDSLSYSGMNERKNTPMEAHEGTFDWAFLEGETRFVTRRGIFQGEEGQFDSAVQMSFKTWLRDEHQGLFYFTGKPGSGKSTLMKRLACDDKLATALKEWASGRTLLRADHYFWIPGKAMQKTLEGMLRSLLYSVLRGLMNAGVPEKLEAIKHICGDRWLSANAHSSWSRAELENMLSRLSTIPDIRSFFLIDALDECEPQDRLYDLATNILRISRLSNIKVCVSCRPWKVFTNSFAHCQTLRLDQLTYCDMETYVRSRLDAAEAEGDLQTEIRDGDLSAKQFIWRVIDAAEGVFIWTKLVTNELCSEVRKGRNIGTLDKLLSRIPADLDEYFHKLIFNRIGKSQQNVVDTAAALKLAMEVHDFEKNAPMKDPSIEGALPFSHSFINFWLLCNHYLEAGFSWEDYKYIVQPSVERMTKETEIFLRETCNDLLVLLPDEQVDFFHRTVFDYLSDNRLLLRNAPGHLGNHEFIMELARLRCICLLRIDHKDCQQLQTTLDEVLRDDHLVYTRPWTLVCESLVAAQIRDICTCSGRFHLSCDHDFNRQLMVAGFDDHICNELALAPYLAVCGSSRERSVPNFVGAALQAFSVIGVQSSRSPLLRKILECGSDPNAFNDQWPHEQFVRAPFSYKGVYYADSQSFVWCRRTHWEAWLGESYLQLKQYVSAIDRLEDVDSMFAATLTAKRLIGDTIELLLHYGADPRCFVCTTEHSASRRECNRISFHKLLPLILPKDSVSRLQELREVCAARTCTYALRRNQRRRAARSLVTSEHKFAAMPTEIAEEFWTRSFEDMMGLFASGLECSKCDRVINQWETDEPVLAIFCLDCGNLSYTCLVCTELHPTMVPDFEHPCESYSNSRSTQISSHTTIVVVCGILDDHAKHLTGQFEYLRARHGVGEAVCVMKTWYAKNPIEPDLSFQKVLAEMSHEW